MAKREEYNACMRPYITGKKDKETRKLDFCVGAKMCSGKAKDKDEARTICLNAPPKPPKERKRRRKVESDCEIGVEAIDCVINKLLAREINTEEEIKEILFACFGGN